MGRKKIIGVCAVEECRKPIDSLGWCTLHYQRHYKHGTTDKVGRKGKSTHPLNSIWWHRYGYGSLPPEWMDFWKFVEDVGERPSKGHYFYKIDRSKPYSKNNFKWVEHIRRQPNETDQEWNKRKWQQRLKLKPSLYEYGSVFRELELSLDEYSKLYLRKLEEQNNLCIICNKPETQIDKRSNKFKRLAIDHCHKTKKIRGLLCSSCNHGVGCFQDSIILIQQAINYLDKYEKHPTGIKYSLKNKVDYFHKIVKQNGHLCEICNKKETRISHWNNKPKRLTVDHCHSTNVIRGLICACCNTGIGKMKDSISLLQNMIKYLKLYS